MHHFTARTCAARFSRRHGGRAAVCAGGIRQRRHGEGNPARRLHAAQDRLDGVSGGRNLRADRAGGRADRLGAGAAGFFRPRLDSAAADAAVCDADAGGRYGRAGAFRRARRIVGGLAGYAVPAALR